MTMTEKIKGEHFWKNPKVARLYYSVKPLVPRWIQIHVRRFFSRRALPGLSGIWPVDPAAGQPPADWEGWPDGRKFALVLTHDVESERGLDRCKQLADMEVELGFRSSFNFLLKKYAVPDELRTYLMERGFEVGIHGCYHDGRKFNSREIFLERAAVMNRYLKEWDAAGFRAPSMQCVFEWIGDLDIEYDLSTFDTDPFEPNSEGVGTIFPYIVNRLNEAGQFVEMPYTLPQDSTLFILLGEKNVDIWKKKLDWIAEKGGMALLNIHPDYMVFDGSRPAVDEYSRELYGEFLGYVQSTYGGQYYHALPRELACYFTGAVASKKTDDN